MAATDTDLDRKRSFAKEKPDKSCRWPTYRVLPCQKHRDTILLSVFSHKSSE